MGTCQEIFYLYFFMILTRLVPYTVVKNIIELGFNLAEIFEFLRNSSVCMTLRSRKLMNGGRNTYKKMS